MAKVRLQIESASNGWVIMIPDDHDPLRPAEVLAVFNKYEEFEAALAKLVRVKQEEDDWAS